MVAFSADEHLRALRSRVTNMVFDFMQCVVVNQRTLSCICFQASSWLELSYCHGKLFGKLVIDGVLHQEPIGANAGLTGVAVLGGDCSFDGGIEIRVIKHNKRSVTPKFQRNLLYGSGALRHQQLSDLCRAGEGELAYLRVGRQLTANLDRRSRDHVEDAFWNACPLG